MQLILLVEAWLAGIDSRVVRANVIQCDAKVMFFEIDLHSSYWVGKCELPNFREMYLKSKKMT